MIAPRPALCMLPGRFASTRLLMALSSMAAAATVAPGRSRATTLSDWIISITCPFEDWRLLSASWNGTSMSAGLLSRNSKSRGSTPITVYGTSSNAITFPITLGSAPKLDLHTGSLNSTVFGPAGRSSTGRKLRPSCGVTPSTFRKLSVTRAPRSRCGAPAPVSVYSADAEYAAMSSNTWFWFRQPEYSSAKTRFCPWRGTKLVAHTNFPASR